MVVAVLVVSVYGYEFTSFGRLAWTCPSARLPFGGQTFGTGSFSVVPVGEFEQGYSGTGAIAWCIYSNSGSLERSYRTDRILGRIISSTDGRYVVAAGYKVLPGPAGIYANGTVYLFDGQGVLRWSVSTVREIFSVHINSDGSVIVANMPELLYLNNSGVVLWKYSAFYSVTAVALANDGADVVAGLSDIAFPGDSNYGSKIVLFDAKGNWLWNFTIRDQQLTSTNDLAVSNGHVAAGVAASGWNGTLYYLDLQGNMIWSKRVSNDISSVSFDNVGSTISILTNSDQTTFDLQGNVITNQTRTNFG